MKTPLVRGMALAIELTRAGKLEEATALIRSLLRPGTADLPASAKATAPHPSADADVIDGTWSRAAAAPSAPTPHTRRKAGQSLRETLRRIAAGGMPDRGGLMPVPPEVPEGAQFLSLAHDGAHGGRTYRLYLPAHRPERLMPLVVMLHGCTQSPEDFAVGTGMNDLAEEAGCLVAWPAQPQGANLQKCWNWFRPEDQGRDRGEPAVIAGIVRDILRTHPADPKRVYVAGLSAGGAAAAILGAAYPDLFAAACVHSGLPVGGAQDVPSAFSAMRNGAAGTAHLTAVPTIVFHGLADLTVHPDNGAAVLAQGLRATPGLTPARIDGVADGGRSYRQTRHEDGTGRSMAEHWEIDGAGHAWAGGRPDGSFTDPTGPDASREMLRFFLQHSKQ